MRKPKASVREHRDAYQHAIREIEAIEREAAYYEALNPQPFPLPGAVCRCSRTRIRPAAACDRAIRGRAGDVTYPCSCWCHVPASHRTCGCTGMKPHECHKAVGKLTRRHVPACPCDCHKATIG